MTRRIRAGRCYVYRPVLIDAVDNRTGLNDGDKVRAIKSPRGCPPLGTMGHCYVADPDNDKFIGLVCCNSLQPCKE